MLGLADLRRVPWLGLLKVSLIESVFGFSPALLLHGCVLRWRAGQKCMLTLAQARHMGGVGGGGREAWQVPDCLPTRHLLAMCAALQS
jgi:hypothetical protein